jgi:hypothetical protein
MGCVASLVATIGLSKVRALPVQAAWQTYWPLREGFKKKREKKMEFSIFFLDPPPSLKMENKKIKTT